MKKVDDPSQAMVHIDPAVAARMIMASADLAVFMDRDGVVRQVLQSAEARLPTEFGAWVGRKWVDCVAPDSMPKAQQLLADAAAGLPGRLREINHLASEGGATVPLRYSAQRVDDTGQILAVGRDLRALASLQQQLVQFQQSMEREYGRLRAADTRYRVLFQLTTEPILIADAAGRRISEANPAAVSLLGLPQGRITGRPIQSLFADKGGDALAQMLSTVSRGAPSAPVTLKLADGSGSVTTQMSWFRQDGAAYFLMRLSGATTDHRANAPTPSLVADMVERLPDGFVVTDGDGMIMRVNSAFLDMAGLANAASAIGQNIEQWLGRTGVDFGVLRASVRDGGSVRHFATVLRGAYGQTDSVELSAVGAVDGGNDILGFLIRPQASGHTKAPVAPVLPRSTAELKQLVGTVPLKELVRETTDIIEKLCIEAALELTGDNRASAAEMLGVSRQGLYAKMHRFGIGDLTRED